MGFQCAKILLKSIENADERKLYINKEDTQQRTALPWAAAKTNQELVTYLLEYGSDPFKIDVNGESALQAASKCGNKSCICTF